jgi:hypothetical protein
MSNLEKAFKLIEKDIEFADFTGGLNTEQIDNLQDELNLIFPDCYRKFLSIYGMGDIHGVEIYGAGNDNDGIPSTIWFTKVLRETANLPLHLLPVYESGFDGEIFCIDCSNNSRNPIVLFIDGLPIEEQEFEVYAESFGDFLYDLLVMATEE